MSEKMMYDEITLQELFAPFLRKWKIVLIATFLATLIGIARYLTYPKVYEAITYMNIGRIASQPIESIQQLKILINTPPVFSEILLKLNIEPTNENIQDISSKITYEESAGLLKISVADKDSKKALAIVSVITSFIYDRHYKKYLEGQKQLSSLLSNIKENVRPIPLTTAISELKSTPTTIVIEPYINPIPTRPVSNIIILNFSAIGFLLSLLYIYLRKK